MVATDTAEASIPGTFWQWRGHSIYYVKAGRKREGISPLLLVHGFGASTDHWRKNIAQLKEDFEVWAIDLLGFGRSAKADVQYSGDLWRDQLDDFITEVIGSSVVLVGNSLGGYCSLCVASQRPSAAVGLVLLNSAGPFTDTKVPDQNNSWQEWFGKLSRWVLLQPLPSYLLFQYVRQKSTIRKTLEKVYLDRAAVSDRLIEEIYRPSCDRGAVKVFASVFKTPRGEMVDSLLKQLQCPLLLLWGEGDPWMNAHERGAKFKQYYPNLTEHYLRAGHCPHDEVPAEVNRLLREWVFSVNQ
ncbi:MAG: alpha/beta fold hydrolase [Oscillatoria sp. PMC 1068.18]|nr:alpha/beta fold hydrolase [Oscillatoria sp. PMC 1076.18]MEC4991122.1 alpha/beta fold hydrolase [Oscillatoria sp. PMC 1068.18]